ncbi:cupin domain-containing protein [Deinococcus budaensis]|uniref:Quercetin dioxygenase-like cupin family protein n=1 Tax=Deinococcus budaensis TaxID=1665626 RepID=A0A7W8GCM3_9DEIO|nr:cupin domain-containing protein [Deinococcus budaensis]MBB5233102.1 quercetin dioxygenase-like cupin family protein [Deinococcus budaensis]
MKTAAESAARFLIPPQGGTALVNPIGGPMVLKLGSAQTAGAYSVHDNLLPPGSPGPRPHLHRWHEETFYVLDGELSVRVAEQTVQAPAGSFVVIPRGTVHQPFNPHPDPVRVLLIFSPGGMEDFFVEAAQGRHPLQALPQDPAAQASLQALTGRYGYEFAELPPAR